MNVTNSTHKPCVMGIINVTSDSFHAASRVEDIDVLRQRVRQILDEGGAYIDVGACSTRPGAPSISEAQEMAHLQWALPIIHAEQDAWLQEHAGECRRPVSVDTFRAAVAEECVTHLGADIINDISGGTIEPEILDVVARTGVPYILMHMRGTPETMQQQTDYPDGVAQEVCRFFEQQIAQLDQAVERAGAAQRPKVILDPGFGFAKTVDQNYELMSQLGTIIERFAGYEMLVGISRKSMIQRVLSVDAAHALNGTTVLNAYALLQGATILRVHDVREAVEATRLCAKLASPTSYNS